MVLNGGKSRWADRINERLGRVGVYVEPFCGSFAVGLRRDPSPREITCDTDGLLCLAPETKVLRSNLVYTEIGNLEVGDGVLGFDEFSTCERADGSRAPSRYRRWSRAVVTGKQTIRKPCYRMELADGTVFVASRDHQWITGPSGSGARSWTWATTRGVVPLSGHASRRGGRHSHLFKPAPGPEFRPSSYEHGWLGGMLDGEGSIHLENGGRAMTVAQRLGTVQTLLEDRLRRAGVQFSVSVRERGKHQPQATTRLLGTSRDTLGYLMMLRPERLIENFVRHCDNISIYGRSHYGVALVSKEYVGEQEVVALETDCGTYIAEGFASHNCNLWRSIRDYPDETAYYAAWPTIHQDLTARQPWLIEWRKLHAPQLVVDPLYCDPKVAGWWVWGASNWIGGGWCQDAGDKVPKIGIKAGGDGVQAQRGQIPRVADAKRPVVSDRGSGGQGVQAQRVHDKRPRVQSDTGDGIGVQAQRANGQRPHVGSDGVHSYGQGVQAGRAMGDGDILTGERWQPWFRALAKRLERVVVLNRSWESTVTPSMLQHTPSGPKPVVGIFMDPPYLTEHRDDAIYHGDENADEVATAAYAWAVEHGEKYRIAYACRHGDFEVPKGWTVETDSFAGVRTERRKEHRDCVLFSPACVGQQEFGW